MMDSAQTGQLNGIQLSVFSSRLESVCEEMGAVLQRAAFSPNIKDRLDFSCAVFNAKGELCAQAAHIPVHLGSMAFAMSGIVSRLSWREGDMVVLNDPFLGGTHLPDVTLIAPVFVDQVLQAFVVNRAHHASIGCASPGSMPLSTRLDDEGMVIEPVHLIQQGELQPAVWQRLQKTQTCSDDVGGDFAAQISANKVGLERLQALIERAGVLRFQHSLQQLNDYGERLARRELALIPPGHYHFVDRMDDDGAGQRDISIAATVRIAGSDVQVDFADTAAQVAGNINCPLSVAAAAVYYVFRCLLPDYAPSCAGLFRPISIDARLGCLLNAQYPAAVAAGNVETSTRVVDVLLGALAQAIPDRIPAASHGSMNNVAMGARDLTSAQKNWDYYETIGGGMGAHARGAGLSAVQTHMTNTLNTPVESLEMHYPLRVRRYAIRRGSGGSGLYAGGDGLLREFEFLQATEVTLLTERRLFEPWGLEGGGAGKKGENYLNGAALDGKCHFHARPGDVLAVATPGGGGYGKKPA